MIRNAEDIRAAKMAKVLIIDDDKGMSYTLSSLVEHMGHDVVCTHKLDDGLKTATSGVFDVVFLDVQMPDGNGLDALPVIRESSSKPEVIIITAFGDPDGAEIAIKNGAWDYIQKPSSIKEMSLPFVRALQYREEKSAQKPLIALKRDAIIGNSPQLRACLDLLAQAANSDANILITGETGTGKELFSRAIHENSARSHNNFVVVDCGALPDSLVESILFGHEKGAFTGADKAREGLIKQADGGTLFLDEVGELPLSIQKAFLRFLEERRFRVLGAKREIESDFRLVASTNRKLDQMVKSEKFRKDLLFRLRSFSIDLPPLREHKEDIKELAMYYVARFCERYEVGIKGFSPEFFDILETYDWPGNVRELVNTMERVLAAAQFEPTLFPRHLPTYLRTQLARNSIVKEKAPPPFAGEGAEEHPKTIQKLRDYREVTIARLEEEYLIDLIRNTEGNINKALKISGLHRSRFYELLKKYQISLQR